MDVHAEHQHLPRDVRHVQLVLGVALAGGHDLVGPGRERMGSRGHDAQILRFREITDGAPETEQLLPRFLDVGADGAAHLDLRLEELRLDLILEDEPSSLEKLLDVRGQLPGLRVDDLVLLLHTQGQLR